MKQHLKLLLTALFCAISFAASAEETQFTVGYEKYSTIDGTDDEVRFRGYTKEPSGLITIDATVIYNNKKYRITEIGERACWNKTKITRINILGEELRTIGAYAFEGCTALTAFFLPGPNVLMHIGDGAFSGCTSLVYFMTDDNQYNVTTIGDGAFFGCSSLSTKINMTRLESLGINAFRNCSSLTQVVSLGRVTAVPNNAFYNCTSLAPVPLNGVESIGQYAFFNNASTASSVWDITIGSTCRIDDYAFYGYKGTMNITGSYSPYSTLYIDSWGNRAHTIVFDGVRYEFSERAFRKSDAPASGERTIVLKNSEVSGVINDPSLKTLTLQNTKGSGAYIAGTITNLNVLDEYCTIGGFASRYLTAGFKPNASDEVMSRLKSLYPAWAMLDYQQLQADRRELATTKRELEEAQTELSQKEQELEDYKAQVSGSAAKMESVKTYFADIAGAGQKFGDTNGDALVSIGDVTLLTEMLIGRSTIRETSQYVDLGLTSGTMWATKNLGASHPCDDGDFYAWGETMPKETYVNQNYIWNDENNLPTKYTAQDMHTTLESADDAATVILGPNWKTPSPAQLRELLDECTVEHVEALNAYIFTGPNGNRLYMPLAGFKNNAHQKDDHAFYMSSDLDERSTRTDCHVLLLDAYSGDDMVQFGRRYGFPVRPVYVGQ